MAFIESRFPDDISYGSASKFNFSTRIVGSASGFEARNSNWEQERFSADISYGIKTDQQLHAVIQWFKAVKGRAIGFRYKDWMDFFTGSFAAPVNFTDVVLIASAVGGETTGQLFVTSTEGGQSTRKDIRKPVTGVLMGKNGGQLTEGSDFSINYATGEWTLTAPLSAGDSLTWGGEYDKPVRFASDVLAISKDFFEGGNTNIDVIETRRD